MASKTHSRGTCVGKVQDVSGTSVSIALHSDGHSGLNFVGGQGYRIGQIGSFVKIPVGYLDLFGIVAQVGASAAPNNIAPQESNGMRWMTVQLIGEGFRNGAFQRGISQYPTIDDEVHLVSESDLRSIYGRTENQSQLVRIGHISGSESIDALIDINKLINRHSAVLGTTGSGKSTTVAGLLTALSDKERFPSARIVLLDLHGEYSKALGDRATVFRVSPSKDHPNEHQLCIPFWALSFEEVMRLAFGHIPADNKARNIILERIVSAKVSYIENNPIPGVTPDSVNADSPIPFSLSKLWHDLYSTEFGTYFKNIGSPLDPNNWAYCLDGNNKPVKGNALLGIPPKFRQVKDIKDDPEKIHYIPDGLNFRAPLEALGAKLRTSRLDFILKPGEWSPDINGTPTKSLADLMKTWLGGEEPITILDLSGVPSTLTTEIIGSLLRVLYDGLFWSRNLSEGGRERPLLIVMEEAHSYLGDTSEGAASLITQRIVKEGRKYGIGAMIVSQRPSEINSTILSQCGTFFAMRLANSKDRSHVTGALSDNLEGLTNMLPVLRTGEAIVLGEAVKLPMRTLITPPPKDRRPDSQDPIVLDEAKPEESMTPGGWNRNIPPNSDYQELVATWLRQHPKSNSVKE